MGAFGIRFGVIDDARRRQRRRRALLLIAMLAAVGIGVLTFTVRKSTDPTPTRADRTPTTLPAEQVLSQQPGKESGMGVACHRANSISCDRVGVIVWLRHPAISVSAVIAGRTLKLDDPNWSQPAKAGQRTMFAGFLANAGLRGKGPLAVQVDRPPDYWAGAHPVDAPVRLLVTYADGSQQTTTFLASLAAGWG